MAQPTIKACDICKFVYPNAIECVDDCKKVDILISNKVEDKRKIARTPLAISAKDLIKRSNLIRSYFRVSN